MELSINPNKSNHKIYVIAFVVLSIFLLLESLQYHKKVDRNPQKWEISSDRAGYWVYSLIWFDYGYKSANYPEKLDSVFDYGFSLENKVIKNKYTCGVAYLQAPFYLANKAIANITGSGGKPTSTDTRRVIDIAGIFYLLGASLFLYFLLIKYVRPFIAFASICMIVAGTNVFFYAVYQPGMSHIYSFFLFSAYLFLSDLLFRDKHIRLLIPFTAVACLIVLIRPTDILFLPIVLFLRNGLKENIRIFIKPVSIFIILIVGLVVFAPQMYYWHMYAGKFIYYSYENEGFSNWLNPHFKIVLFPAENGLFPYSLLLIVLIAANIYAIIKKQAYAIYFLLYQIVMVYLIASWHCPDFAAGYGQRNFVQIFAGYSLILAFTFNKIIASGKKILSILFVSISMITILMNQRIIYKYDQAFMGWYRWDWREYYYYLSFNSYEPTNVFNDDKTNEQLVEYDSNTQVLQIKPENEFSTMSSINFKDIPFYFKKIKFEMDVRSGNPKIDFNVNMKWTDKDSLLQSKTLSMHKLLTSYNKWTKVSDEFRFDHPLDPPMESTINIAIHNIYQQDFEVANPKILFH